MAEQKILRSYRLDGDTLEIIGMVADSCKCSNSEALRELVRLGGTVWLQKFYKKEEKKFAAPANM